MTLRMSLAESVCDKLITQSDTLFCPREHGSMGDMTALSVQIVLRSYLRELAGKAESQNQLARMLKIAPGDLSELVNGKRRFTIRHIDKIVAGLDVRFSDFLFAVTRTALELERTAPAPVAGRNLARAELRREVGRVVSGEAGEAEEAAGEPSASSPPGPRR